MKKFVVRNLNGFLFWIIVGTVLGFFSKFCFLTDICCHFRIQYIVISLVLLFFYLLLKIKDKIIYIFIAAILLLNIGEVIRCSIFYSSPKINKSKISEVSNLKIGLINILTSNKKYETVRNEILQSNADIIVIEEIDDEWEGELQDIKQVYPYSYEYTREDNFGIAIYSKIPVKNFNMLYAGNFALPVMTAIIDFQDKIFEVIAIHTTPPVSNSYFKNTQSMLDEINQHIQTAGIPSIVVGDINSTRFSYNFKKFVKSSDLSDSGSIITKTWSAFWLPFMRIHLDHIFITKDFKTIDFQVGNKVGSDHFPVYANLYI